MKSLLNKVPVILALWVFVLQLFCNIDSYLYAQCGQCDSAVFFMCGKAMMNGMVPYTEFADSKGVLLWFIYGLGYLFDHYSYVGVFWIACLFIWGTLMISYKTARLYLDEKPALLASMILMVPLMYWNFYTETKAEHFCWPAVAWGIYLMMRLIKNAECRFNHYLWLGVGFIACLMIKWSIAIMMLCLIASVGWLSWNASYLKKYLFGTFFGIIVSILPFAIYFTIVDNWQDMWQEYFVNTMASVSVPISETMEVYGKELLQLITTRRFIYLVYTLPVFMLWNRQNWFSSALPALCGLFFVALSIRHDYFGHYISIAGPFAIMTIILVVQYWQKKQLRLRYLGIIGGLASVYVIWGSIHYSDSFCTKAGEKFDKFMAISAAMSQVENPKIIIIGQDRGLCMATSLPGTRYWITQWGRTEKMWQEQLKGIESGRSDFLVLFGAGSDEMILFFESKGYFYYDQLYAGKVFSKKILSPIKPHKYSTIDILTKKEYTSL